MNPIETTYAGCRFRSRLEARWANFFDYLGIGWEYEPQGYLVGHDRRPYLPDFHLPHLGLWVEVKGNGEKLDLTLMADAVHPTLGLGRSDSFGHTNMLILGPVPTPGPAYLHHLVSRPTDSTCEQGCVCTETEYSQVTFWSIPKDIPDSVPTEHRAGLLALGAVFQQIGRTQLVPVSADLTIAEPNSRLRPDPIVTAAYRNARSARFEHGETT